jgi:membrane-bound lytic murein transglycosylase D
MELKNSAIAIAATVLLALAGCEETSKRPVRVRPPETAIAQQAQPTMLPLNRRSPAIDLLMHAPPAAVDVLIQRVEEVFESGEDNNRAGHPEKARKDFDRAMDTLLSSGVDLQSDPRLEQLFDRLVETVHSSEAAASKKDDGSGEQRVDQAPIDEIAEIDFPADPKLKERFEAELVNLRHDLPLTLNDKVFSYLNFFQTPRGRAIVEAGLRRAGRYRDMIRRVLQEEGLPLDLIYLAQAESGFKPLAQSRARALGMWQFVLFRGRQYGLRRTWWVDERQDPEKATRAAARHLKDLYAQFGDWYLVMAAYNSGPGSVQKAIERTGYADFWELHKRNVLPRETKNYVPIIIALMLIAKDPARHGINVEPETPVRVDRTKLGHPINLRLVADVVDASVEDLRALNPQLLRMVTPADSEFELKLPEGTSERLLAEIALIPPEKWTSWRRHRVEEGETLGGIAKKYRTDAKAIAAANGLDPSVPLQVSERLIIPTATSADASLGKLVRYRVRRGDTLPLIAEQFGVSAEELRRWNGLSSDRVARGATLKVYPGGKPQRNAPRPKDKGSTPSPQSRVTAENVDAVRLKATASASGSRRTFHRVQPGETLWAISRIYQTTVEALRRANPFLASRSIRPGDQLAIPSAGP